MIRLDGCCGVKNERPRKEDAMRCCPALLLVLGSASIAATIRVPSERETISEAMLVAENGDTVLVAPGEYVVTRPIEFYGREVILRSERGPLHLLEMRHLAPDHSYHLFMGIWAQGRRNLT